MNGELSNLRDIVVPDPVPGWPPTVELTTLVVLILGAIGMVAWYAHQQWQGKAYRREGLALLTGARSAHEVSVVLKRVALAAFPREEVAWLTGDEWVTFLQRTCPDRGLSRITAAQLDEDDPAALKPLARTWIQHHTSMHH